MTTTANEVVTTTHGRVRGATDKGVQVFRGIPYGASTAGAGRFMPPKPAEAWTGERDATAWGPLCPQDGPVATVALSDVNTIGALPSLPLSEDCLVLNVWTPAADGAKRPVMFWLHGRGFRAGGGSEGWYNGANLATRGDVVVITINHRLNAFGHLYLGEIGGPEFASSGMVGMLDAVLALEWVRDNVAAFGGDPDNVMIFGESGGGAKVSTLLALPQAQGLFNKAAIQSGPGLKGADPKAATAFAEQLLAHLGIPRTELRRLQELPHEQITAGLQALEKAGVANPMTLRPVVDGTVLPRHPFDPDAPATALNIPVIVGTNRDEFALYSAPDPRRRRLEEHELEERMRPVLKEKYDAIVAPYRKRPDNTPWDIYIALSSERTHRASIALAERKAAQAAAGGAPVYMYLFAFQSNFKGGLMKSAHSMEIPFVFDHPDVSPFTGDSPDRAGIAATMSQAWLAFARTGDPNYDGLPHWPAYDATRRSTMVFNTQTAVVDDPRREELANWEGISFT